MIVCCCFGTTDREIRAAFGPKGTGKCPAGQGCGSCQETVRAIVSQAREAQDEQAEAGRGRTERRRS